MKVIKRRVTLIELLLVMFVLALAVAVIGLNVNNVLREQRFKSEVGLVVDYLRLAQNLMLIMNADTHVFFMASKKGQGIEMELKVDENMDDSLLKVVTGKKKKLYYIQFLEFFDVNKTHNEPDRVDVKFISKGSVMSKGIMRMSTNESGEAKGALERYVCLPGYPKPLYSTSIEGEDPACNEQKQTDFALRLITFTVQEIQSKQPPPSANPNQT